MTFKEKIYNIAAKIPKGKVATYGQLATIAGNPQASRVVGLSMKTNPDMNTVPCHRVVASDGKLTGYAFGKGIVTKKEKLLEEGVVFKGDRVDLAISKWNGK
ncbi:MAG TPA: MGMT family protein [Candidatus Nanoarchaeia archaeon]|nr:MGMT family protein [Candidatus Nanoarchaeia archaeon]